MTAADASSASAFDFDLFVIGGGSGGVRAARMAGQRGARVALAEVADLGGTCVNVGCIPKKLYSQAAHYADAFVEAEGFGWDVTPPAFDWARLKRNRAAEIGRLNGVYARLLDGAKVQLMRGWARVTGTHEVTVDGKAWRARHILIATGGTPFVPEVPGREHVLTSDQMFDLDPFPARLLVIGGGYIACEMASIFNGLGSQVVLAQRGARILNGFDDDVARFAASEMGKTGLDIRLDATVAGIVKTANGLVVTFDKGAQVEADAVLYATGRLPNARDLGLEQVGIELDDRGAIPVDKHFQTRVAGIHAVGDVSSSKALTPVALAEAMVVVDRIFGPAAGKASREMSYDNIPTAVFTHPNIATVGLTEAEARAAHGDRITIFRTDFKPLRHTLSGSSERTFMKLVVDAQSDRVLGLHMVGPEAGEIVQGFAVALRAGATKALFDSTIGIHPTSAEEFVTMREPSLN